jgi:glycosyltransferase involved in cell wall biosynthesis
VFAELLAVCRRERVAIWHGHDYKSNALGLLVSRFWPMHLVTTLHGWVRHTSRTPLYYRIDRFCLPRYEKVVAVSPDLYDASRAAGVSSDRCVLIENGIDTEQYLRRRTSAAAKASFGVPSTRLVIGAVGRLSTEKGFDLLIRATTHLLRDGIDAELWIVGTGDERQRLEDLISETRCGDRVRLLGYRADMIELYEAMDLFVLSSLREGLPNVLLEAMALEVPVVATRIAGVPRLIRDETEGILIEPGREDELARAMGHVLGDSTLRNKLARAGRERIETSYSFRARMAKMQRVYDEVLGRVPVAR